MGRSTDEFVKKVWPMMKPMVDVAKAPTQIADEMNAMGLTTQRGHAWSSSSVCDMTTKGRLLDAMAAAQAALPAPPPPQLPLEGQSRPPEPEIEPEQPAFAPPASHPQPPRPASPDGARALEKLGYKVIVVEKMDESPVSDVWCLLDRRTGKGSLLMSSEALDRLVQAMDD